MCGVLWSDWADLWTYLATADASLQDMLALTHWRGEIGRPLSEAEYDALRAVLARG